MVYCLSVEKYPRDEKVIPYESVFPNNVYKVRLISSSLPNPLPSSGADVQNLSDNTEFAVGSKLYVVNGENGSEIYIYSDGRFILWGVTNSSPIPDEERYSNVVGVGQVGYMVLGV